MSSLPLLLAVLPFGLFLLGMAAKRITLKGVSFLVLGVVLAIQVFYWKIVPIFLLNSLVKGFLVAFDIFLIVFGAVFFLEVMKEAGVIQSIGYYLRSITKDYRVQVVLLAWFFVNFIEGVAGFGTPGAIVAPILVSLGLSPLTAVVISLLGNSVAGAFGAVGTPIRVGFSGLEVGSVPQFTVLFNAVGILIPVFMVWILAKEQKNRKSFVEVLPFALWAGVLFTISSLVMIRFGWEFVSITGSLLATVLMVISLRLGIFVPKKNRVLNQIKEKDESLPLGKVLLPYAVLLLFLAVGKTILGSVTIRFPWGYEYGLSLFNPGWFFFLAGVIFHLMDRKSALKERIKESVSRTVEPFLVVWSMSSMIQIIVSSGNNFSGLPSIIELLAKNISKEILPLVAPFIGAFGSFVTGSVTISNILFGNILSSASVAYGLVGAKVLALEVSGAAIGNSMAIADIMAAEAAVGLKNGTRSVLRRVVGPCLICLSILGITGLVLLR